MKKLIVLLLFFIVPVTKNQSQTMLSHPVDKQILIRVESPEDIQQLVQTCRIWNNQPTGFKINRLLSRHMGIWLVEVPALSTPDNQFLAFIKSQHGVLEAQRNHLVYNRSTPNDPQFSSQWQWLNTGQNGGTKDADVDADQAWDITTGGITPNGDTIVVAIVDDGTSLNHPDLKANLWVNKSEIPLNGKDDDGNGFVDDFRGWDFNAGSDDVDGGFHGTNVGGMVGAVGNNSTGVTGINQHVKLMNVVYAGVEESSVIEAYDYVLTQRMAYDNSNGQKGAYVVATNSSWGIDFGQPSDAPLWCAFYDTLGVHGILSVAATANQNIDIDAVGDLPTGCSSPYLISVTATSNKDLRTFSAYGKTTIDLGAPGDNIFTTSYPSGYTSTSGTSFASPLVAGVVALLYSAPCALLGQNMKDNPSATALYIKDQILSGVDKTNQLMTECVSGGRANVYNSLQSIMSNCVSGPCPSPSGLTAKEINPLNFTLGWNSVSGSNKYAVQYRIKSSPTWTTVDNLMDTVLALTNLMKCTEYEFKVAVYCMDTLGTYSFAKSWMTGNCCFPPTSFSLFSFIDTSCVLDITKYPGSTSYNVLYRPVGSNIWTTVTGTAQKFKISPLLPCTDYEITVQTICGTDVSIPSPNIIKMKTKGCGLCELGAYCESKGQSTSLEFIDFVGLNTINNNSGDDKGYGNYLSTNTTLKKYYKYNITVKPGFNGSNYTEGFNAWIDFNHDEVFSASEMILSGATNSQLTASFTVPAGASLGNTRLRVSMQYGGPPSECAAIFSGEVEDYCITIEDSEPPCISPDISNIVINTLNDGIVFWTPVTAATSYLLYYRKLGEINWNIINANSTNAAVPDMEDCTVYEFAVKSTCLEYDTASLGAIVLDKTQNCGACTKNSYCMDGQGFNNYFIKSVKIGTNSPIVTGNNAVNGYYFYKGQNIHLDKDSSYAVTIQAGTQFTAGQLNVGGWIDYNQDGLFDQVSENMFASTVNDTFPGTFGFTVPFNAVPGITRMRLFLTSSPLEACNANFFSGEVEDYCVEIFESELPCNSPRNMDTFLVEQNAITFQWDSTENSISTYIKYRKVGATEWEERVTTALIYTIDDLKECTEYEFEVYTICPFKLSNDTSFIVKTKCMVDVFDPFGPLQAIKIYPNPVRNSLYAEISTDLPRQVNLQMRDISGKLISNQTFQLNAGTNQITLNDLQYLAEGMYLLQWSTPEKTYSTKVLKVE